MILVGFGFALAAGRAIGTSSTLPDVADLPTVAGLSNAALRTGGGSSGMISTSIGSASAVVVSSTMSASRISCSSVGGMRLVAATAGEGGGASSDGKTATAWPHAGQGIVCPSNSSATLGIVLEQAAQIKVMGMGQPAWVE
ncbi:MAG: hypothetical protein MUF18_12340 [Fimbriiglobus sp.]|nr:hypothetical protein [Fimbriiglobus sp.]